MAVLEAAGVPAPVRANVDSIFHSPDPSNGYNPDEYTPPDQYQPWVDAGRPTHDVLGRELDVRGQLAGGQFSPFPTPGDPSAPPVDQDRPPDFSEVEGDIFADGAHWRQSFSGPDNPPHVASFTNNTPHQYTLYGDSSWLQGDVAVYVDKDLVQQQQAQINPGQTVTVKVVCLDIPPTRERGTGPFVIDAARTT